MELKKSTGELKDAMHSACAMLNGSGAKRIIDACKEQNVQEPTWEINDSSVKVIFVRKYSESIIYEDNTTNKTTNNPTTKGHQAMVKAVLVNGEKSIKELMYSCGYKDRRSFKKSILNEMIEKGWVAMTHPENPNHRNQKYYLKELGKKAIGKK